MNRALVSLPLPDDDDGSTRRVMGLLAAGVPLSLLCDLADPAGPDSRSIYVDETPAVAADADFASHPCMPVTQFGL